VSGSIEDDGLLARLLEKIEGGGFGFGVVALRGETEMFVRAYSVAGHG